MLGIELDSIVVIFIEFGIVLRSYGRADVSGQEEAVRKCGEFMEPKSRNSRRMSRGVSDECT